MLSVDFRQIVARMQRSEGQQQLVKQWAITKLVSTIFRAIS